MLRLDFAKLVFSEFYIWAWVISLRSSWL